MKMMCVHMKNIIPRIYLYIYIDAPYMLPNTICTAKIFVEN